MLPLLRSPRAPADVDDDAEGVANKDGDGSLLKEHTGTLERDSLLRFFSRTRASAADAGAGGASAEEEDGVCGTWASSACCTAAVVMLVVELLLQSLPGMSGLSGAEAGIDGDSSRLLPFAFLVLREMGRLLRLE